MTDNVNSPRHYVNAKVSIEPIYLCEHFDFCHGNALKYVVRAKLKGNEVEDLKKAVFYLDRSEDVFPIITDQQRLLLDIFIREGKNELLKQANENNKTVAVFRFFKLLKQAAINRIAEIENKEGTK